MKRYTNCLGDLAPLKNSKLNESEYLLSTMRYFIDQGHYDNEHLANVSLFLDTICKPGFEKVMAYNMTTNIDPDLYRSEKGKKKRCRAVEVSLDSIYEIFRRPALNHQEPMDFSEPQFYANETMKLAHKGYNLSDLINVAWIMSETPIDHTCSLTNSLKSYIAEKSANSTAQDRSQQASGTASSYMSSLANFMNRLLDGLFGIQRRVYWESTNRGEQLFHGLGNFYKGTRERVVGLFASKTNTSSTITHSNNSGSIVTTSYAPSTLMAISDANLTTLNQTTVRISNVTQV